MLTAIGLCKLGTLDAQVLPPFLTSRNTPLPQGFPWGNRTVEKTMPYIDIPNTGVIRPYHFTIRRGFISPDGVNRSVVLVNDQFPGPLIEANWGDKIQVTVHNKIEGPEDGTSLHFHGFSQKKTPWYDGVPSVTQCPIAPGKSFTYQFQASNWGTSWWHGHYSSQYAAGLFGPLVVYGPVQKTVKYDVDLGPIILSDWYHREYRSIIRDQIKIPFIFPDSNNNLIQGKGNYDCSKVKDGANCTPNAGLANFRFQRGKKYRLRLINTSADAIQKFTIDGHSLTVFTNDFVPIKPYTTNVVTLGIGQRSDVVVEANGKEDAYWMRSDISKVTPLNEQPRALAAIYYGRTDTMTTPKSKATVYDDTQLANDPLTLTTPVYSLAPPKIADKTFTFDITLGVNATNHTLWFMNGSSFRANYNNPLLLLAKMGNTSYPESPQWNVYNSGDARSVRVIVRSFRETSHPMHLHGHDFWVLASGRGTWNGSITNPQNPNRRDTQLLPTGTVDNPSYIVLQFDADNPGVWPLHCHVAWHVSTGLHVNIITRPKDIVNREIPYVMAQTYRDWSHWTGRNVAEQIDSGL